jgi:hypothetical protein
VEPASETTLLEGNVAVKSGAVEVRRPLEVGIHEYRFVGELCPAEVRLTALALVSRVRQHLKFREIRHSLERRAPKARVTREARLMKIDARECREREVSAGLELTSAKQSMRAKCGTLEVGLALEHGVLEPRLALERRSNEKRTVAKACAREVSALGEEPPAEIRVRIEDVIPKIVFHDATL